jgi:uncharacterized membrane protein
MTTEWIIYACLAIGLCSALVAGVFQSFSDFVMKALVAAEPRGGIEAMQMINRTVFGSVFLVMMLGIVPLVLGLAVYTQVNVYGPAQTWITAGAVIYVISVFLVTMFGNVPMNNRLDSMDRSMSRATTYWRTYSVVWTRWNHVRTLGSVATAICFIIAGFTLA